MSETRALTSGERALVHGVFGRAIDNGRVEVRRRRWFPFQPRDTVMAPCGHLHFAPDSEAWREDFSVAPLALQGLFVHEMTHVWQAQIRGRLYLPLMRHPFCRYDYRLVPGRPLARYGLEQQGEIVRHAWLIRQGHAAPGHDDREVYEQLLSDAFRT